MDRCVVKTIHGAFIHSQSGSSQGERKSADMETYWQEKIQQYIALHKKEAEELLKELAIIPAPAGKEEKRAAFCKEWLLAHGAKDVFIDQAGNVICPYHVDEEKKLAVYMAHLDVVFPDEEELCIVQEGNLLIGPGVGDDTANLVNLLLTAAFFVQEQPECDLGILFVADTGEEGLGNLKGCRELIRVYGSRISHVISFDLYLGQCFHQCVGSLRYEIAIQTEGGHSFSAFGNKNAIHQISRLICTLYEKKVPEHAQTTYNVGIIEGGTSVNTIAQDARVLYEIRSVDAECMEEMRSFFEASCEQLCKEGIRLTVKQIGERPCAQNSDDIRQKQLTESMVSIIEQITDAPARLEAASTDANIPLSAGIPALTIGTIIGGKAHTREEWIDLDSQAKGLKLALSVVLELS